MYRFCIEGVYEVHVCLWDALQQGGLDLLKHIGQEQQRLDPQRPDS